MPTGGVATGVGVAEGAGVLGLVVLGAGVFDAGTPKGVVPGLYAGSPVLLEGA